MRRAGVTLLGALGVLSGCVYYNAIYNAQRLYGAAERDRLAGRDSLAAVRYARVVEKAAKAYRREPDGAWADDALYLIGRARLHRGELRAARAALREAARISDDESLRQETRVYLGAALIAGGQVSEGVTLLNEALRNLRRGPALGDGHLWRGRVLLGSGQVDSGWWDLDRAIEARSLLRVPTALERIRWGVRYRDLPHTRDGVRLILHVPDGGARRDTVGVLLERVAETWGPGVAADLLAGADSAAWSRRARGDLLLMRARFRRAAGDTAGAERDARKVSGGIGPAAAEARLLRVRWLLERAPSLDALAEAIPILLPAQDDPEVERVIAALRAVQTLADPSHPEPLSLFAAAELARDELHAPLIARGLFLAYAQIAPDAPWAPKALLAAMALAPAGPDRDWLRTRLEGTPDSPYVLAQRGAAAPGLEGLETELAERIRGVLGELPPEVRVPPGGAFRRPVPGSRDGGGVER